MSWQEKWLSNHKEQQKIYDDLQSEFSEYPEILSDKPESVPTNAKKEKSITIPPTQNLYQKLDSRLISESRFPKDVMEFCGESAGSPSMVIFSHGYGVRQGYVNVPERVANMTCDTVEGVMPIKTSSPEDSWLDRLYEEQMGFKPEFDGHWVVYDCGHTGETYDEQAIRAYFPDEAEDIIKKNAFRNMSSNPVVRTLEYCKDANVGIAVQADKLEKAMDRMDKQKNSYERE